MTQPLKKGGKFAKREIFLSCKRTANPCRPARFQPPVSSLHCCVSQVIQGQVSIALKAGRSNTPIAASGAMCIAVVGMSAVHCDRETGFGEFRTSELVADLSRYGALKAPLPNPRAQILFSDQEEA